MKPFTSGVLMALSLVLLLPMAATAQETSPSAQGPTADSLVMQDATGDLYDIATLEPTDGPAYMDLTGLEATVDGEMLSARFDVAEAVPVAPDPLYTTVHYILLIDTDADDSPNLHVDVGSEEGWQANLFDYGTVFNTQLGEAAVADASLTASVPLADLGSPTEMRFQAVMEASDYPDPTGDPLNVTEWGDRVPDAEDEWLGLGTSVAEQAGQSPTQFTKGDLDALVTGPFPKVSISKVMTDLMAYFGQRPDVYDWLDAELRKATRNSASPFGLDGLMDSCGPNKTCLNLWVMVLTATLAKGDPALYDIADEMVDAMMNMRVFKRDAGLNVLKQYVEQMKKGL